MTARRHRRRFVRWLEHGGRFYFYLVLTVVIVSYIAVPWAADFISKLQGYDPKYYEPKDQDREDLQKARSPIQLKGGQFSWQGTVKLLLLAMVAILWMVSVPTSWKQGKNRPSRR